MERRVRELFIKGFYCLLLSFAHEPYAEIRTLDLSPLFKSTRSDQRSVAQAIRERGFQPELIQVHWEVAKGSEEDHAFSIFYDRKYVGNLTTEWALADSRRDVLIERKIEIKEDFRFKGFGALLSLAAGMVLFKEYGEILHRSGVLSEEAKAMWSRFLQNNWAEESDSSSFALVRLSPHFLRALVGGDPGTRFERFGSRQVCESKLLSRLGV